MYKKGQRSKSARGSNGTVNESALTEALIYHACGRVMKEQADRLLLSGPVKIWSKEEIEKLNRNI